MIFYHGLPITPESAAVLAIRSGHAFVSHADSRQLGLAASIAQSFAIDNGAFSAWRLGKPIVDFSPFYTWVEDVSRLPGFDFAVIPDVVDGSEEDNDALVDEWPWKDRAWVGAPVWHLHESLGRLESLGSRFPRICLGSSGDYSEPGTDRWWDRISAAMGIVCDTKGRPQVKIHGLRMMAPDITRYIPFSSVDSTNIARNIGIDGRWTGAYRPKTKEAKAAILRHHIETQESALVWAGHSAQDSLFHQDINERVVRG